MMNAAAMLLEQVPAMRRQVSPVSVEEYHTMGEFNVNGRRTELIRGVIIEKARKSPLHVFLHHQLYEALRLAVGPGRLVHQHDPLTFADSEPEPDLAVVSGAENTYLHSHPQTAMFVVEFAEETVAIDRVKADLYAEAGIPECWIVLVERSLIEVHTQPRGGFYREQRVFAATDGGTLASTAVPALRLDLATFFVPARNTPQTG